MAPLARAAAVLSFSVTVVVVGATTKVAAGLHEGRSKNSLRPYGRHTSHRSPEVKRSAQASARKVQQEEAPKQQQAPAPTTALVDTGIAAAASQPYADVGGEAVPRVSESSSMLKGLKQELAEMKQRRVNINSLQQALAADVALLRESAALQRVSSSQQDRAVAAQQVRQSEQIVKDTGAMLRESRMAAMKDAQAVLRDQSELQAALEALKAEAAQQLQAFSSTSHTQEEKSQGASMEPSHYPAAAEARQPAVDTVASATVAAADDGDDDP